MGCTPSSQSSQSGLAYGCGQSSSANDVSALTQEHRDSQTANRSSIEMNGTRTGALPNSRETKDSLVSNSLELNTITILCLSVWPFNISLQ